VREAEASKCMIHSEGLMYGIIFELHLNLIHFQDPADINREMSRVPCNA
jgi:hypothetical protein